MKIAFLGLGISGLRNRMGKEVPDRVLLPYAGLLNQQPRSMIGMELLLSDHYSFISSETVESEFKSSNVVQHC